MITPEYCRSMARHNAWQNRQYADQLRGLSLTDLTRDRGAFFGSILGTLSHLVWADQAWMARFDPSVDGPVGDVAESVSLCPTLGVWSAERHHLDGKISHWAGALRAVDLSGDLAWHSASTGGAMRVPLAACIAHMFNHQTHHRGQIHAMMTAAGLTAPVSDLFLLPE
ncbi:MAG: DinB family protein [Rhodobacteraceae bacterium]|nr:DinB family protein [Paracoccaceae bacterium]